MEWNAALDWTLSRRSCDEGIWEVMLHELVKPEQEVVAAGKQMAEVKKQSMASQV